MSIQWKRTWSQIFEQGIALKTSVKIASSKTTCKYKREKQNLWGNYGKVSKEMQLGAHVCVQS